MINKTDGAGDSDYCDVQQESICRVTAILKGVLKRCGCAEYLYIKAPSLADTLQLEALFKHIRFKWKHLLWNILCFVTEEDGR